MLAALGIAPPAQGSAVAGTQRKSRSWYRDPWANVALLTGVAGLAVGSVLWLGADSGIDAAHQNYGQYSDALDDRRTHERLGQIGVAAGGLLLTIGLLRVWYYTRPANGYAIGISPDGMLLARGFF